MNCMKCGRELKTEGVFCDECLAEMENYPIKPGAVVHLPRRTQTAAVKKQPARRKPHQTPEEQVKVLRKLVLRLILALTICIALLIGTGYFAVVQFLKNDTMRLPGQNYNSVESTVPITDE